jgi:hypothetical protein
MAASAWTIAKRAKHHIGNGNIDLSADNFRLTLHRSSASTNLTVDASNITVFSSVGSESSGGGYSDVLLSNIAWTNGASAGQQKFDCTDPIITASSSTLSAVRYAVIRNSIAAASGRLLCFAALSTAEFNVTTGNTLTIQMASTGIFTLT